VILLGKDISQSLLQLLSDASQMVHLSSSSDFKQETELKMKINLLAFSISKQTSLKAALPLIKLSLRTFKALESRDNFRAEPVLDFAQNA